jgi:hypothetical protein
VNLESVRECTPKYSIGRHKRFFELTHLKNLRHVLPISYVNNISSFTSKVGAKFTKDSRFKYLKDDKTNEDQSPGPARYELNGNVEEG